MSRRSAKVIPRLPPSAFAPTTPGTADTFPLPPTPSLVRPTGVVDAHLHLTPASRPDTAHLPPAHKRAVVLAPRGLPPDAIARPPPSLADVPVLSVLVPFALDSTDSPDSPSPPPALTAVYDGAVPVAPEAEEDTTAQPPVEAPVRNLRWALQHSRVVDLDIQDGILTTDTAFYDSLINLLTRAIKSDVDTKRTTIVLTNILPPPLGSITPVVTMMNHPSYTIYRQRISLLSLFESVCVKLLPPTWISTDPAKNREMDLKDVVKLFIAPVLEAFGFERIIFGSSPAFADGSPALAENWYRLVLESFRELAVSQGEMDKIFIENAERAYGSA